MGVKTILIVDDDEVNRAMLSRRLVRKGYEIVLAADAREGILAAERQMPSAILMDIELPDMSGMEAVQQLKAMPPTAGIPVIALTGHAMPGDRDQALLDGFDEYETKPIDLAVLLEKIEGLITRKIQNAGS